MPIYLSKSGSHFPLPHSGGGLLTNLLASVSLSVSLMSKYAAPSYCCFVPGEMVFIAIGVACQVASIFAEAIRLILVQILLQRKGIKLNPVTTMCYVAPSCLVCLVLPFVVVEAGRVTSWTGAKVGPGMLLGSAALAFALNCSVFLLIGKSSALTMNIAGIVKDLMLIGLSVLLYK